MPGNNIPPTHNFRSPRSELALQQHGGSPQYGWNWVISTTGWKSVKAAGRQRRFCRGPRGIGADHRWSSSAVSDRGHAARQVKHSQQETRGEAAALAEEGIVWLAFGGWGGTEGKEHGQGSSSYRRWSFLQGVSNNWPSGLARCRQVS